MRLNFNLYEFLTRMLPHHKRQTNRLALFYWPLKELQELWDDYNQWRFNTIYESNITGQKLSLLDFLNNTITGADNGISIIESEDLAVYFSTLSEDTDWEWMSTLSEDTDHIEPPLDGEAETSIPVDFRVIIPTGVSAEEVRKVVNRYAISGFDFDIVTI